MNIAIIPARGGSKGLPGKNIRKLNGRPLITYTIEAALYSGIFERVLVSTDSREIADISLKTGAEVPFLRPKDISGDKSSSADAVLHAISELESMGDQIDVVCMLQPTSPLRTEEHIKQAYELMLEREADYVVSVCECEHSPLWSGNIDQDLRLDNFIKKEYKCVCRQDLPPFYRLNGAIYLARVEAFKESHSFLGKNSIAYIMGQDVSVDIDSILDFKLCELIMKDKLAEKSRV